MNQPKTFTARNADVSYADYESLRLTGEEYMKLVASGHPGSISSPVQASGHVVFGASDMSQLRDACADADADALLTNCNVRVIKIKADQS